MGSWLRWTLLFSIVILITWLGTGFAGFDDLTRLYGKGAVHLDFGLSKISLHNDDGGDHDDGRIRLGPLNSRGPNDGHVQFGRPSGNNRGSAPVCAASSPPTPKHRGYAYGDYDKKVADAETEYHKKVADAEDEYNKKIAKYPDKWTEANGEYCRKVAEALEDWCEKLDRADKEADKKAAEDAREASHAAKKEWNPAELSKSLLAQMEGVVAQACPGARLKRKDVRIKRKDTSAIIYARGNYSCNGITYEIASVAVLTSGSSTTVNLTAQDVDLQFWADINRKGASLTNLAFSLEGNMNVASLSTQWQDATIATSTSLATSDWSGSSYVSTQGSGNSYISVSSNNTITGRIQVVIVPTTA